LDDTESGLGFHAKNDGGRHRVRIRAPALHETGPTLRFSRAVSLCGPTLAGSQFSVKGCAKIKWKTAGIKKTFPRFQRAGAGDAAKSHIFD
jgi:hypothetical protein